MRALEHLKQIARDLKVQRCLGSITAWRVIGRTPAEVRALLRQSDYSRDTIKATMRIARRSNLWCENNLEALM